MLSSLSLPTALAEGQTLAGKYLLARQLGEGGMCVVYEVEHIGLRQSLALKVLKPELASDPDCVARFEREARAAAQLRSPNVAKVFDVDYLPGGQPYITMELLVGHDLGVELQKSGRIPIPLATDYVRQACAGIGEAHALGIVHRDLKPENLFLTELGELTDRKLVKILDFGIAKNIADSARRLTAPDSVFGTVDYMSPEQIRSASQVDRRTDIWSLGVILYELLTGRTPYSGDARSVIAQIVSDPVPSPALLAPELPPSLVATVMRALEKDPAQRFQSAEELRTELLGYGDFEPNTSVIARLPPQSIPRRLARTSPSIGPASANQGESPRDQRTHGSWETKSEPRTWGKTWVVMPAVAMVLGAAAGFTYWKSGPIHLPISATTSQPASTTALPTPDPSPLTMIDASAPLAPTAATQEPTSPAASAEGAMASAEPSPLASAKNNRPPRARPPVVPHTPPPTAPPAPPTSPAATRLPKHL